MFLYVKGTVELEKKDLIKVILFVRRAIMLLLLTCHIGKILVVDIFIHSRNFQQFFSLFFNKNLNKTKQFYLNRKKIIFQSDIYRSN